MQIERTVDPVARIIILEVAGDVGDRDLLSLADELEKAPDVRSDFSLLIDLRHAKGVEVTKEGVQALARRMLVLSPTSRRAVVVPSSLGFGMARMYQSLSEDRGGSPRVFRDYGEAKRWVEFGV